jgi:UDPglucose 6-dehydrogenase
MDNITIIGTGYVGLVTGACFAEMGHSVTCLDIDEKKIENLNKLIIPIYEPGLEELVKKNKKEKRIFFTTNYQQAIEKSKVCFICVPTPSNEDGSCNTSYIESAALNIAKYLNDYKVIVTKSTSPVGTSFEIKKNILNELKKRKKAIDFDVVSNPEFLKEGSAVQDFFKPDRIVIGCENERSLNIMKEIYQGFTIKQNKLIVMDILSSEMTKYAANAMLATRISFMNEIAKICKNIGANVNEIRKGIGSDSRIGYSFLYAGIGYGGSCFPKDIRALCHLAKKANVKPLLLQTVDEINNEQKKVLAEDIISYFSKKGGLENKIIAIWGLSFKPDTDDMREAPSLTLIDLLLKKGAKLRVFDPIAMDNAKKILKNKKNIIWCKDEKHAAEGSDAIALLTEWKQFRLIDFTPIKRKMKQAVFFDGRNQYHSIEMQKKGFKYIGIGVPDQVD